MSDTQATAVSGLLAPGTKAPDFTLQFAPHQNFSLSELRGKPVILAFYPADWSPTCGDQIGLYNEVLPEFQKFGAELLGISVDGPWCHKALCRGAQPAFPSARGFRTQGSGRQAIRSLPQRRWDQRTRAVRDRQQTASSPGAISRRSGSIPAPMESWKPWRSLPK